MPTVNELIDEARQIEGGSRNAATIVSRLLYGPLWDKTLANPVLHRTVMRGGWDEKVRHRLKDALDTLKAIEGVDPRQLDLWPETLRGLVKSIDRAGVYVPSRDEFAKLEPEDIRPVECTEAGEYLVKHGRDSIRRGNRLIRLGELGGW